MGDVVEFPDRPHEPTLTVGAQAQVDELLVTIRDRVWPTAIPAQAAFFLELQQTRWHVLAPMVQAAVRGQVCQVLHIPPARFDFLLTLFDEKDLRRALRWRPDRQWQPDPGDDIYPMGNQGWIGNYLSYARECKAPLGFQFWTAIAVLGAACRRNFYYDLGGDGFLYPNQMLLFEGPSGTGKGMSIYRGLNILELANQQIIDSMGDSKKPAPIAYILTERTNPSAMYQELKDHATVETALSQASFRPGFKEMETCAVLPAPELMTLLGEATYNPTELVGMVTKLYDGRFDESTISRGVNRLKNISFTCLFGSTITWLRSNMSRAMFGGGFLGSRMAIISRGLSSRARIYHTSPPIDPVQRSHLANFLVKLMLHPLTELLLTPEADERYKDWFSKNPILDPDETAASYFERREVHLLKLAMALTVSHGNQPWITLGVIEQAIHLLETEEKVMLPAFTSLTSHADNEAIEFVLLVVKKAGGSMYESDILQRCRHRLGAGFKIRELLVMIAASGLMKIQEVKTPNGRNRNLYYLPSQNPKS